MEMYEDMKEKDARIAALRARVVELERVLQEIVEVDPETQIGGVSSYLYAWEQCHTIARAALAGKDDSCAMYRCTVCGRVGAVGRCCGDETRERISWKRR